MEGGGSERGEITYRFYHLIPTLIATIVSCALTALFALAGAFTGAIAGALAGRASDTGVLRGAGLGAIAGAVFSLELLGVSSSYWCLEHSTSRSSSPMVYFMEELLRGRFAREQFAPSIVAAYQQQVSIANLSYDETYNIQSEVAMRGLSRDSLRTLPCHLVLDDMKANRSICCAICLQDIEVGEIARSLPQCCHTFHLACVDKWLIRHGSCPICRQDVGIANCLTKL